MTYYFVTLRRFSAAGILELETGASEERREEITKFVELQLDTLGPGDIAELTIANAELTWLADLEGKT